MSHYHRLELKFENDSEDNSLSFFTFNDALQFARNNICYSNNTRTRVVRVRIYSDGHTVTVWDRNWDEVSKAAGLAPRD